MGNARTSGPAPDCLLQVCQTVAFAFVVGCGRIDQRLGNFQRRVEKIRTRLP
jgi:hypothetical protein